MLFKGKEACVENKQNYATIKREERWRLGEKTYKAVLIKEKQPIEQKRRVMEKNKISSSIG